MNLTYSLFNGENLQLEYDRRDGHPILYLGSTGEQWYFLDLEKARHLRNALNDGIKLLEERNNECNSI